MRCPNCGNENPPDYMFCDECGARLGSDTEQAATSTPDAAAVPATPAVPGEGPESFPASTPDSGGVQPYVSPGFGGASTSGEDTSAAQPEAAPAESYGMPPATEAEVEPAAAAPSGPDFDMSLSDVDQEEPSTLPPTEEEPAAPSWDSAAAAGAAAMPDVVPVDAEAPVFDSAAAAEAAEEVEPATAVPDYGAAPTAASTPSEYSPPGVYIEEVSSGARPIGGVGTSTAGMSATPGATWAADALSQLDTAQASLASGDWAGFASHMSTLRTTLQEAAAGAGTGSAAGAAAAPMAGATEAPTPYMDATPAAVEPAPSPTLEPAAEAGTLEAGADAGAAMGAAAGAAGAAATSEPAMSGPMVSGALGMARLVVISTGAELPLPDQEEITVGREDPSSGIFPDVDLTPYGGEDGGVSRRHARLLHIGGDYFVEDLQSTNYTKLDGQRLPAHVRERLEDGARLDFGRVAVIFRRS
ncbi:MAG TPA: FHA domain-containing protein [Chloroflexia bacterium]|nr:FHA domain-containing protein [Chloroflexia bacterium]